jgi:hypothetical protein
MCGFEELTEIQSHEEEEERTEIERQVQVDYMFGFQPAYMTYTDLSPAYRAAYEAAYAKMTRKTRASSGK